MSDHRRLEERSIELHRAVAEKLGRDSAILERARRRVAGWLVDGTVDRRYAEPWMALLDLPLRELEERLVDPSESMRALRQCSPFAGALTPRERWDVLRRAREVPVG